MRRETEVLVGSLLRKALVSKIYLLIAVDAPPENITGFNETIQVRCCLDLLVACTARGRR